MCGAGELRREDGCEERFRREERGEDSVGKVMKHAAQVSCL